MPFSTGLRAPAEEPLRRPWRLLVACGTVAAATLLRLAVDPFVGNQIPYFSYVGSAVIATWLAGVEGGVAATLLAAVAGNYFFVEPRHRMYADADDLAAMLVFSGFSLVLVWVVGRWRRAEGALRRLHAESSARAEELQTILETVPAAVFVARDASAVRIEGNRRAADYLAAPPGANLSKTAPVDEVPSVFRTSREGRLIPGEELPVQQAIARGAEIRDYELDVVYPDATKRTLHGNAAPLRDRAGRVRGAVGAFIDVTERKRMEVRLREQTAALEEANRMKDEFFATLSHELRTPLNSILGWSDMLLRPGLSAETQRRALESINRNAKAQAALISDILDVSRIISGKLRLDRRPVDVTEIVKAACESIQPAADAKGIQLTTAIEGRPVLVGDPERLQQVLWNLLSNSVKFSRPGGRVDVLVRLDTRHLILAVSDEGAGIPPDALPHIFEPFRQADSSTTREQTGLGLGLAIVRHLVELHGGTVRAESPGEGRGATFTVELPARPSVEPVYRAEPAGPDQPPDAGVRARCLEGLHVLAVDDQDDARTLVGTVLVQYGARVTVCQSAEAALAAMSVERPDVLLADIGMPLMDGYELIRRIRALEDPGSGLDPLPAVALTAFGSDHDRLQALAAGYAEHIPKPISPDALVRTVAAAAGRVV
jgi:signal transduction histidine kinase/CheY-like chemotaxis protein